MAYQFQVLVKTPDGKGKEWKSVRPTGGQPYEYPEYDTALNMLRMCYPGEILGQTVRVVETQNTGD